jgi:hypothetical protein
VPSGLGQAVVLLGLDSAKELDCRAQGEVELHGLPVPDEVGGVGSLEDLLRDCLDSLETVDCLLSHGQANQVLSVANERQRVVELCLKHKLECGVAGGHGLPPLGVVGGDGGDALDEDACVLGKQFGVGDGTEAVLGGVTLLEHLRREKLRVPDAGEGIAVVEHIVEASEELVVGDGGHGSLLS